ncbi:hypothetical protein B7P43_G06296 [Cryptotermes secundus]|uniref:Uncharacterized protein n=1 Tax=Cryptotermes secundus TaxID=105785 RepID=A0A2J7PW03_9NEOP|nr:hypothetical protein B7P43_G06296 [Cryptotermes secundus]
MFSIKWTLAKSEVMDGWELASEVATRPECQLICDSCSQQLVASSSLIIIY